MATPVIVVHGGAGRWQTAVVDQALAAVGRAAAAGRACLLGGESALDAVVEAVRLLEDVPILNAGTGSVLNIDGEVEMDAAVMVSDGLRAGGVGAVRRVRNPVALARQVMELTEHVLLVGDGALRFARATGVDDYDPVTAERRKQWRSQRDQLDRSEGDAKLAALHRLLRESRADVGDTVGAVALDRDGRLAAATSTGGVTLKLPGRVGDSPVPGAGNYATPAAAVSATGQGELMLRFLTARAVVDAVVAGDGARAAVERVLAAMAREIGNDVGIIAVDAHGGVGVGHRTPAMPHAIAFGESAIQVALTCDGAAAS